MIPYYEKWVTRFPTLEKLAETPLEEVLKYWAGLGYYRRVKMLHQAAQYLVHEYNGKIPDTPDELLKIPGIGRYTAGAIVSIAFNKKAALVDGNVIRILTRLYAIKQDIGSAATIQKIWTLAETLVPESQPGDFNQAMMELGATVCLPTNPACLLCPVSTECRARAKGHPENFPVKEKKEKMERITTAGLVLKNRLNHVLIQKQPSAARWGGLWMFPFDKNLQALQTKLGLRISERKPSFIVRHSFTKYRIDLRVYVADDDHPPSTRHHSLYQHKWVPVHDLKNYAFPSPHQKIIKELLAHG